MHTDFCALIDRGRALPPPIADIFLRPLNSAAETDAAPITPFMLHVARMAGVIDSWLMPPAKASEFAYWFIDSFHAQRAPYRWPIPPHLVVWLNTPARTLPFRALDDGVPYYITRFMAWVDAKYRSGQPIDCFNALIDFLNWYAFDYGPLHNVPGSLLPSGMASLLRQPVPGAGKGLPLTFGIESTARRLQDHARDKRRFSDELLAASSFLNVESAIQAGDPRLVSAPEVEFWTSPVAAGSDVTAFEYFAERARGPEAPTHGDAGIAQEWFRRDYLPLVPNAAALVKSEDAPENPSCARLETRNIVLYRDHTTSCGLSKAGKHLAHALEIASVPFLDLHFSLGRNDIENEFYLNESQIVSTSSPVHIFSLNPEYVPECMLTHLSRISEKDVTIAQFYWELSDVGWSHECALALVDEIWVASKYLRDVYQSRTHARIIVTGQAVEPTQVPDAPGRAFFGLPEHAYTFLVCFDAGSVVERKNPLAAVRAFLKAFPDPRERTALVVKASNVAGLQTDADREHWREVKRLAGADSRIYIFDRFFTDTDMAGLYEVCDCFVSLHRSEGFGFGPAEAMARKKPVILTAYSGVLDFCTPESALLVNCTLVPVPNKSYPYMDPGRSYYWAEPELTTASNHMRSLYDNPAAGQEIGARAGRLLAAEFSVEALSRRYVSRLTQLGVVA